MTKVLPFGIKLTRTVNLISIVLNFVIAVLLVMIAVPNFIRGAQQAGGQANPVILTVFGIVFFIICSIPAVLLIILNKALWNLKPMARVWQIVISLLLLLAFPVGTILNLAILYFMLFDKKTKEAFISQ